MQQTLVMRGLNLSWADGVLSPVHTGDYSLPKRRQIVAEFGDNSATVVASVDRALLVYGFAV